MKRDNWYKQIQDDRITTIILALTSSLSSARQSQHSFGWLSSSLCFLWAFSSPLQVRSYVFVWDLAEIYLLGSGVLRPSSLTSKLPGMTIWRWTLIQDSYFYPSDFCQSRERRLDEGEDGLFILLPLHTSVFHSHGWCTIILSFLFSSFLFYCLSYGLCTSVRLYEKGQKWEHHHWSVQSSCRLYIV